MAKASLRVSVIGLGYIGLPTAVLIAKSGVDVLGVDNNEAIIKCLNKGSLHIFEPGLDKLLKNALNNGKFSAVSQPKQSNVFIITVPTPINNKNQPDISYILNAVHSISSVIKKDDLIILESTSPVGTTEKVSSLLQKLRKDLILPSTDQKNNDVNIAYCPERVIPGNTLHELVHNDRVLGGITDQCSKQAEEFYKLFIKGNCFRTDSRTAELSKLIENSYRDVNISFANEVSMIADEMGINAWELINISNRHPRVNILNPGPGVGGHCIPVDPWFIVASSKRADLIKTAREVNLRKTQFVKKQILKEIKEIRSKKSKKRNITITFLGLTFKPDIDDLRDSPALEIVSHIVNESNLSILIVEPNIKLLPLSISEKSKLQNLDSAIKKSDIIVNLVAHKEFRKINKSLLKNKSIMDFQGTFS